jgi:hypothetical protein
MTPNLIADRFATILLDWLTPVQFLEMKHRNENNPTYADGAYASHDFCDANMAMHEAFQSVTGHCAAVDSEADTALWNDAWVLARKRYIGRQ